MVSIYCYTTTHFLNDMKALTFFIAGLLLVSVAVQGQTIRETPRETPMNTGTVTPPNRVQANFNARYPDFSETTSWQESEQGYQASFRENDREVISDFDENGRWLQSRTELPESDWPDSARDYISKTYPEYEYINGYRYDDENGRRYEIDLRSQNQATRLNFDGDGGFLREGPVEEDF